jgi:hypothetical protein
MKSSAYKKAILVCLWPLSTSLFADPAISPSDLSATASVVQVPVTPSALVEASPTASEAVPVTPISPVQAPTPGLLTAWHPEKGDHALNLSAFNGLTLGWMSWFSDHHSEEDLLSLSLSFSALQNLEPNSDTAPNANNLSCGFTYASIQRWRIKKLGQFGDLNILAGPYLSYSYNYGKFDSLYSDQTTYQNIYGVGLKAGLDVEMFPTNGWSIQLGYLASGAWQDYTYINNNDRPSIEYAGQYTTLAFSIGTFQAGLNYYFK